MGASETHANPFFEAYLGRIKRDSIHHLLVQFQHTNSQSRNQIIYFPKLNPSCKHSKCPSTPVLIQERNIKNCSVPHTGLVLIFSHIDLEDGSERHSVWTFWADVDDMRRLCIRNQQHNRTAPLNGIIRATFRDVDRCLSSIHSTASSPL